MRRVAAVGLAVAALAFTPAVGAVNPGAGVIPQGMFRDCTLGHPTANLTFDFVGRMPAGSSAYTVTSGRAQGSWNCFTSPIAPLRMVGDTPSGRFVWTCEGSIWLIVSVGGAQPQMSYRGLCATVGLRGRFELVVLMQTLQDRDPSIVRQRWTFIGAYVTGPASLEDVFRTVFG